MKYSSLKRHFWFIDYKRHTGMKLDAKFNQPYNLLFWIKQWSLGFLGIITCGRESVSNYSPYWTVVVGFCYLGSHALSLSLSLSLIISLFLSLKLCHNFLWTQHNMAGKAWRAGKKEKRKKKNPSLMKYKK